MIKQTVYILSTTETLTKAFLACKGQYNTIQYTTNKNKKAPKIVFFLCVCVCTLRVHYHSEATYAHKSYILFIKKYSKNSKIFLQFKITISLCEYIVKCNLFLWSKLNFQYHSSSLQCHMIFRNHSNMLICCSRNIYYYYQCWKQFFCLTFVETVICVFSRFFDE